MKFKIKEYLNVNILQQQKKSKDITQAYLRINQKLESAHLTTKLPLETRY